MHIELDVQETPHSPPPVAGGFLEAAWIDQLLPSQRSASVPLLFLESLYQGPTAVHTLFDMQDTALSKLLLAMGGLGVAWIDQLLPSQRSASVFPRPSPKYSRPTAVQAVLDVHETPLSSLTMAPGGGLGVVWIDQLEPSQCSTSGREGLV